MFIFAGHKCRSSESKRKFIYFAGRKAVGRSHSGLCNRKKIKEQTFLNIKKNGDTNDMTCIIFFRNLNCLLGNSI